jgi:hypothetical protein
LCRRVSALSAGRLREPSSKQRTKASGSTPPTTKIAVHQKDPQQLAYQQSPDRKAHRNADAHQHHKPSLAH